jgi:hypothetical protein
MSQAPFMAAAGGLAAREIVTLRCQFDYMKRGSARRPAGGIGGSPSSPEAYGQGFRRADGRGRPGSSSSSA